MILSTTLRVSIALFLLPLLATAQTVEAQLPRPPAGAQMSLEDLEKMALQNNPSLAQAEAVVRAATQARHCKGSRR